MEPPYRRRRNPVMRMLARLPIGPLLAGLAVSVLLAWSQQPGAVTIVPDLVGLGLEDATQVATRAGFDVEITERPGPGVAGTVVDQTPASGQTASGNRPVALEVTQGAPQVRVPDVAGMPVDEARQLLVRSDLEPGEVAYRSYPGREPGRVIGTDPAAGSQIDAGTPVLIHAVL